MKKIVLIALLSVIAAPAFAQAKRECDRSKLSMGMTAAALKTACGTTRKTVTRHDKSQQWIYDNGLFVYLVKGKVAAWQWRNAP